MGLCSDFIINIFSHVFSEFANDAYTVLLPSSTSEKACLVSDPQHSMPSGQRVHQGNYHSKQTTVPLDCCCCAAHLLSCRDSDDQAQTEVAASTGGRRMGQLSPLSQPGVTRVGNLSPLQKTTTVGWTAVDFATRNTDLEKGVPEKRFHSSK